MLVCVCLYASLNIGFSRDRYIFEARYIGRQISKASAKTLISLPSTFGCMIGATANASRVFHFLFLCGTGSSPPACYHFLFCSINFPFYVLLKQHHNTFFSFPPSCHGFKPVCLLKHFSCSTHTYKHQGNAADAG